MNPTEPHPADRRAVLIGARGMLGRAWRALLETESFDVRAIDLPDFDLTDAQAVADLPLDDRSLVVNCAAYTDVDGAESDEDAAFRVNAEAPGRLAERCAATGATLVHYSTDYVFDGESSEPYPVEAPIRPLGVYGRSKAEGERRIREAGAPHLIVRTSWLYAPWGKNFVRTMAQLLRERDTLQVVHDQTGRPTSAEPLAAASLALLRAGARGTRHLCGGGTCTWYDLACAVNEHLQAGCRIEPCATEAFPRPAPRPRHAVLDLSLSEAAIGPMPHWRQQLAQVMRVLGPPAEPAPAPKR